MMSDSRDKQPDQRIFDPMPAANYEVEIKAWTYSGIKSENVMSRKLVYHVQADNFRGALNIATLLRDTVKAMHDIWVSEIVRIEEKSV